MKRIFLILTALLAFAASGCGNSGEDFVFTGDRAVPQGFLRFAHFSPDAPNVDILVDGNVIAQNVPFETVSDYASFAVGNRRVQVFATGNTTQP